MGWGPRGWADSSQKFTKVFHSVSPYGSNLTSYGEIEHYYEMLHSQEPRPFPIYF